MCWRCFGNNLRMQWWCSGDLLMMLRVVLMRCLYIEKVLPALLASSRIPDNMGPQSWACGSQRRAVSHPQAQHSTCGSSCAHSAFRTRGAAARGAQQSHALARILRHRAHLSLCGADPIAYDQRKPLCTRPTASGTRRCCARSGSYPTIGALRATTGRFAAGSGSLAFEWLANPPSLPVPDAQPSEQASTSRDV